jgi:ribulose 1,5-bisphosphate synthetase/thiazole synthase
VYTLETDLVVEVRLVLGMPLLRQVLMETMEVEVLGVMVEVEAVLVLQLHLRPILLQAKLEVRGH